MNTYTFLATTVILLQTLSFDASAKSCYNIHAPVGVVDVDSSTADYRISEYGVSLRSKGTVVLRYPLHNLEEFNTAFFHSNKLGFKDSYNDANIKVELVQQQFAPVFSRTGSPRTEKITLIDSSNMSDRENYRQESVYTYTRAINTDDFVYSLEVTLTKTDDFLSRPYRGRGVSFNNFSFCPGWRDG